MHARGLAYLHEDYNPRVIHRDFKASNALLEDDFTPKVSDFGLAREATEGSQHISTRVMGTFGPFMGEVVQALKLIYNDTDETDGDCCSQKESSSPESDFKGDFAPFDSSWWNAGGVTPGLTYG
ncbi:hypothetical protein REPUB_Repub11eG0027300 [Reevesia pubescens]